MLDCIAAQCLRLRWLWQYVAVSRHVIAHAQIRLPHLVALKPSPFPFQSERQVVVSKSLIGFPAGENSLQVTISRPCQFNCAAEELTRASEELIRLKLRQCVAMAFEVAVLSDWICSKPAEAVKPDQLASPVSSLTPDIFA